MTTQEMEAPERRRPQTRPTRWRRGDLLKSRRPSLFNYHTANNHNRTEAANVAPIHNHHHHQRHHLVTILIISIIVLAKCCWCGVQAGSTTWQENVRPKLYVVLNNEEDVQRFQGNDSATDHFKLILRDGDSLLVGAR